jgi:sensor histidine kinase regulating citrate/malate metabolism
MRPFRDLSIRSKLAAIIVVNFFVALALGGIALTTRYAATEQDKLADRLTVLAKVIGTNSSAALAFNDHLAAQDTLAALVAEPAILAARVYDSHDRLFARYGAHRAGARATGIGAPDDDDHASAGGDNAFLSGTDELRVSGPIVLDGEQIGTVVIDADAARPAARRRHLLPGHPARRPGRAGAGRVAAEDRVRPDPAPGANHAPRVRRQGLFRAGGKARQ